MKQWSGRTWRRFEIKEQKPTARHLQILKCAAGGMDWKETARALNIAPQTVKNHRANLFERLGARNITHAVYLATQQKLI